MKVEKVKLYCPNCGEGVRELHEGYCKYCLGERQRELNYYNFTFDRWANLTDEQRKIEITNATI